MNNLIGLVNFYAKHWQTYSGAPNWSTPYGWLSAASLVVLLLTILFALLRRLNPREAIMLIGQHVLILGFPFLQNWGAAWF